MIPSVGDISFYLQTMVNDFTADILLAFGSLAGQIERRNVIQGPWIISPLFQADMAPLKRRESLTSVLE